MLKNPVEEKEILKAMFGMKNNKAPGPDGFTASFYKGNWDVVSAAVLAAVSNLFNTGVMLRAFNSTTLTLIPKSALPATSKDYGPISSCNII